MKKVLLTMTTAFLLTGAMTLMGCSTTQTDKNNSDTNTETKKATAEYQKLSVKEAKDRIDSGDDLVILDVRTAEEYAEKHIPGAVLLPNEDIETEPLEALPDLEQEILVYCRSGNRSAQASKKLLEAGYTNIYDFGGINDWPYETEVGAPQPETASSEQERTENSAADGLMGKFETSTLDGEKIDQDIFTKADLTMLNIWGTFCSPCIQEMPELGELSKEYQGKMQIVGLISDVMKTEDETAKKIIEYTGADYVHIINSNDLLSGYMRQVQVVPTTIFLDKEGKLVDKITGAKDKETWKAIIEEMLEKIS